MTTSLGAEGVEARDGENMIIAGDPKEFAEDVVRLLGDDGLCERLGGRARRLAEECFSWEKGVEQLEKILPALAEEGRTPLRSSRSHCLSVNMTWQGRFYW